jgi:hypothetical protein
LQRERRPRYSQSSQRANKRGRDERERARKSKRKGEKKEEREKKRSEKQKKKIEESRKGEKSTVPVLLDRADQHRLARRTSHANPLETKREHIRTLPSSLFCLPYQ